MSTVAKKMTNTIVGEDLRIENLHGSVDGRLAA